MTKPAGSFSTFEKLKRLDPNHIRHVEGDIEISEKDVAGAGTIRFLSAADSLVFQPGDQTPICWTHNRKCADAAIFQILADEIHAHVIELKGNLNLSTWAAVKQQFSGMYLNAIALAAVSELGKMSSVRCCIAFKKSSMDPKTSPAILLKTPLGGAQTIGGIEDWETSKIHLEGIEDVPVIKILRDANGNGEFNLDQAA